MESPLSFDSTENFRKKLLLKNLKPYKVQNGFTSNETTERREIQLIDYAVKDSGNIDDIGNKQEKILFPQNKYGPTNSNQAYGNVVDINKNLNTESNQGSYSVTSTFNSKLNQTGNYQETLLYVQNLYGPTFENGSFGNVVDINKDLQFNTNLGDYRISLTFDNKLKQFANQKETDLIVKNIYKPQGQNGYGDTVWFINNDLTTITNGDGEYNINDTFNNRLQLIGNQQGIFLKVKNVYKSTNDSFGTPAYWINNDQTIETVGSGQYNISDTFLSKLEVKGNDKEIELRAINKYTPNNGTDYGSTKWSITNLITLGSNQGSYTTSNSNNSLLELNGVQERDILFPINQYGPVGGQSQTPIVFSNIPPLNNNEGNYKPTSSIGSPLEVKGEQYRDNSYPLNQYGSESQVNDTVNINSNLNTHTNEGEYTFTDTNGSPLEVGGLIEENKAYVKNKYVPGNGSYEALTINDLQIQTTSQKYYNSAQSFVFVPSDYTPISILLNDNPTGTNGSLSQDSTLAFLGAKQLQRQFKFRIASELISETIGRVNNLTSSVDPISGEVSVQPNLDPFNAVGILSGNVPVLSRNYQVTSPNTIVGQAVGFAAKITGLYSPYSVIPGQYFDYPQKRLLNEILTNPVSILSNTVMGNISKITRLNIKKGSDLLLAYTSPATRDLLWGQLFYNEYRPDYRANSITNPNLFSPKPNFYVGDRGTSIEDMLTPINALPEYKDGNSLTSNVYGFSDVSKEYEGDKLTGVFFGINSKSFFDGNSPITSSFSWNSTKSFFKPGKLVGNKGGQKNPTNQTSNIYDQNIKKDFEKSSSTNFNFKEGSILDVTQKLVDAASRNGARTLEHVGNAINQVSKVFNDGYTELTKGSRVIRWSTKNTTGDDKGKVKGYEYSRIFTKDIPYYTFSQLQKYDGMVTSGRRFTNSVFDNTFNLNIAPMNDNNGQSSNIIDGQKVKKYMFSLENLAWRTSNKPGLSYDDLEACEKGPNGGRIMWFPPYNLTFDETVKPSFDPVNFLGRPEPLYTYKNTERTGSINWSIIVDHSSISDLILEKELQEISDNSTVTKIMSSFFAGSTKYDIYDLSRKFIFLSPNDIISLVSPKNNTGNGLSQGTNGSQSTLDEDKELFLFFDNEAPAGSGGDTDEKYDTGFNDYNSKQTTYIDNAKDLVFSYGSNPEIATTEFDFSYKDYIDTRKSSIEDFFTNFVSNSLSNLDNFCSSLKTELEKGSKVTFTLEGYAFKAEGGLGSEKKLSKRRMNSVINYIKNYNGINSYIENKKLKIKDNKTGDNERNLKIPSLDTISCAKDVQENNSEGIYSIQAMACRSVKISKIKIKPGSNVTETESKPDGQKNDEKKVTPPKQIKDFTEQELYFLKKYIRKNIMNEANYFQMLRDSDPMVYDGVRGKFKHFDPAFHSITPEGLNSRLTFLQQCMRPGDTIPTIKQEDGNIKPVYQDAFNSAFGSPPILVLRIGDFYHTKIVPTNLSIKFDNGALFDINPEGIGIQPMIANISLQFNFIGGQGLAGPISKLQNALSFNYYANTEVYDERADQKQYDVDILDTDKLNQILNIETQIKPVDTPTNNGGETFGVLNATTGANGLQTGTINYKNLMNAFVDQAQSYAKTTYDNLKSISEEFYLPGLLMVNSDRKYKEGTLTNDTKIYGKSEKIQDRITISFDGINQDIDDKTIPILLGVDNQQQLKNKDIKKVQKKLKELAEANKSKYNNNIFSKVNQITKSQQDAGESLKIVDIIDRMNFITQGKDGKKTSSSTNVIFNTSGSEIATLQNDCATISDQLNSFIEKLKETLIIQEENKWDATDITFDFNLLIGDDVYEKKLNIVFGKDIVNDINGFIDKIVEVVENEEDKVLWRTFIGNNLGYNSDPDKIYSKFKDQKDKVEKYFKDFGNFLDADFKTKLDELKNKERIVNCTSQNPINDTDNTNYLNIISTNNGGDSNKFNLKKSFD